MIGHITYRGTKTKIIADFLSETLQVRKQWSNTLSTEIKLSIKNFIPRENSHQKREQSKSYSGIPKLKGFITRRMYYKQHERKSLRHKENNIK